MNLRLFLIFIAVLISACNHKLGEDPASSSAVPANEPSNADSGAVELQAALDNLGAIPVVDSSGIDKVKFHSDMDMSYRDVTRVLKAGERLTKAALWQVKDCADAGGSSDPRSRVKQYLCGEIPYGNILDRNKKALYVLNFEGLSGKSNGVSYRVESETIPIWLSRHQKAADDGIESLSAKGYQKIKVEDGILDNLYYRLAPQGGGLRSDICFFSPGLEISSPEQKLTIHAEKRVWFIKLKGRANIYVNPGKLSFAKAKVCSAFKSEMAVSGGKLQPKFSLLKMQAPVFTDLKHHGLAVDVDVHFSGILRLVAGVLKIVGINLESKIERAVEKAIAAQADGAVEHVITSEIQSGAWLAKYVSAEIFKGKVVSSLDNKMGTKMEGQGPGSEMDLASSIESACISLSKVHGAKLGSNFQNLCRNSFSIKVGLFLGDQVSRDEGCYEKFFSAQEDGELWWKNTCRIRTSIEITAPSSLAPLYNCIANSLLANVSGSSAVGDCMQQVDLAHNNLRDTLLDAALDAAGDIAAKRSRLDGYLDLVKQKYRSLLQNQTGAI